MSPRRIVSQSLFTAALPFLPLATAVMGQDDPTARVAGSKVARTSRGPKRSSWRRSDPIR